MVAARAACGAAAVLLSCLVSPHRQTTTIASPPPVTAVRQAASPALEATRQARATGRPIEVKAAASEARTVYANPDGTFTAELTARPTRVRRGADWVAVDTGLRRADGAVVPGATAVGLSFSAGGGGPVATMSAGAWSLALSWPGDLSTPALTGDSATYPDVLPGVDLVVAADAEGFSERLVVKTRAAAANPALGRIAFRLRGTGVALRADASGGLSGVDGVGATVVTAAPPVMWDAGGVYRPVGLALSGEDLVLRPDLGLLTGADVKYPVTIDPSFTANRLNWAQVMSDSPDVAYWNGQNLNEPNNPNGPMMVGLDPLYGEADRGFFQMGTSAVNGKHILRATFQITEKWANNCQATPVELWETGGIGSGTTWNSQPGWGKRLSTTNVAKGNENFGCGDGEVDFDATQGVVDAAANGWGNLTLGIRASDEGSVSGWKRFDTNPTIAIDYNSVPNAPSGLSVDGKACGTGTYVGTATPVLRATASDPDAGQLLDVSAYWAVSGSGTNDTDKVTQTNVANGGQLVATVPSGRLTDGRGYYWQAQSTDRTDASPWSGQCAFTVDTTRPDSPPTVSSADYPADGNFHGGKGKTGIFALAAAGVSDVASYLYGWADPPTTEVAAPSLGGPVSLAATPPGEGINTLYVRSKDRAGNLSDSQRYVFYAGSTSPPAGWWAADEGSGQIIGDQSGGNHPATVAGVPAASAGDTFSLIAGHSGRCLDLPNGSLADAVQVQQFGCRDAANQQWQFISNGGNTYVVKSAVSGKCLDVDNASMDDGARIIQYACNGASNQQWRLNVAAAPGETVTLVAVNSGKCMDVSDISMVDGALVHQWTCGGAANQQWRLRLPGAASWTAGRAAGPDRALSLTGTTGYAATSGPVVRTDQSFSVAAWVRLTSTANWATVVCQEGAVNSSMLLQYDQPSDGWVFASHLSDGADPAKARAVGADQPRLGVWTHLLGVYDAGAGEMRLYVNGVLSGTTATHIGWNASGRVLIGAEKYLGNPISYFPGDIDDLRVWDRVVYPDEAKAIANAPTLVGAWDLGGDGSDSSGYGHPLTTAGGATWSGGHNGAGGLTVDGTTGYAATTGRVLHTDQSYTVSAWIRLASGDGFRSIVGQEGSFNSGMLLQYVPGTPAGHWALKAHSTDTSSPSSIQADSAQPAQVGVWTHLVGVYDAGAGQLRLYVNGQLSGTADTRIAWDADGPLLIGTEKYVGSLVSWFAGDIDDVRVYLGVLSDQQIVTLFNQ